MAKQDPIFDNKYNNSNKDENLILPNPKVSRKVKSTKKWQKDTMEYFIANKDNFRGPRRTSDKMLENWNFYNGNLTAEDLHKAMDPLGLSEELDSDVSTFEFYDIISQPLKTLFGEALKRKNDVKALSINPDIINAKDREFKNKVKVFLNGLVEKENIDPEEVKKGLEEFNAYSQHDLQSAHEKMANQLLAMFRKDKHINAKQKFNEGFRNYQINMENIYHVYRSGNIVDFRAVDSTNFYVIGLTDNWVENAQCWIEETYMNPMKIIETFPDLTNAEIDKILKYDGRDGEGGLNAPAYLSDGRIGSTNTPMEGIIMNDRDAVFNNSFPIVPNGANSDVNGNLLVTTMEWRGLRKLGKLTFIDETTGEEEVKWVDEYYEIDIDKGEKIQWTWVNEIMKGYKIINDIYHGVEPLESQMRSQINPGVVRPSYVGYIHFNDGGQTKSRLETLMPYQRDYNLYANKLKKLLAQHIGKVAVIDVARIPSKMSTDEWFSWLKEFNISFENSFEMGNEGQAKNMMAGNVQRGANTMDLSAMNEIKDTLELLNYNKDMVNSQSGVPEARQGDLTGKEGLGTSQQAIMSSGNQTEHDFFIQDLVTVKVAEVWLEKKKIVGRDEKMTVQYVLDDLSQHIVEFDGPLLNESDYAVQITDSSSSFEMTQKVNALVHPAIQAGQITFMDALDTVEGTPSEIKNKIKAGQERQERASKEKEDRQAKYQQDLVKMQEEAAAKAWERDKEKMLFQHKLDLEKIDREVGIKNEEHSRDNNQNNIEDQVELDAITIKAEADAIEAEKERQLKREMQDKELKNKVIIEDKKIKNTTKSL